jgi:putative transposase
MKRRRAIIWPCCILPVLLSSGVRSFRFIQGLFPDKFLVWTPRYLYRILQGKIKEYVEKKIRTISDWKNVEILELTIIPPKLAIAELKGILKGKAAIAVFQQHKSLRTKPYWGNHFWSRGYCVTTVGIDEERMRRYVKYQEDAERLSEDHELQEGLSKK